MSAIYSLSRSIFRLTAISVIGALFCTGALAQTSSATKSSAEQSTAPAPNAPEPNAPEPKRTRALLQTSLGSMEIELFDKRAAGTVANFIAYAKKGFYDGTIFHRVIPDFVLQGGGFVPGMKRQEGLAPPIQNEADNGIANTRGTLSMARTGAPHSATSQFFVNLKDNGFLNHTGKSPRGWGYAVFAKVISGMETADKIQAVATGNRGPYRDVPREDVVLESVKIIDSTPQ